MKDFILKDITMQIGASNKIAAAIACSAREQCNIDNGAEIAVYYN